MDGAEDSGSRVVLIEGEAVIHQRFGGAGPSRLNTARENAHAGLMRCTPDPKCVDGAGVDGIAHTKDCDEATGLLAKLREMGFGNVAV
jgi:hypothetical protein